MLEGICKHGIGRHDLMITDTELPFHQIVQNVIESSDITDPNLQSTSAMLIRIAWPKELVIARRIEALCELILRPKPQKRQIRSRKRKSPGDSSTADSTPTMIPQSGASNPYAGKKPVTGGKTITPAMAAAIAPPPHVANRKYLSDIASSSDEDDEEEDEDDQEIIRQKRARYELYQQQLQLQQQQQHLQMRVPTKPLKSQGFRYPPTKPQQSSSMFYYNNNTVSSTPTPTTVPSERSTPSTSNLEDEEMEEGEISYSDDGDDEDDHSVVNGSSSFAC